MIEAWTERLRVRAASALGPPAYSVAPVDEPGASRAKRMFVRRLRAARRSTVAREMAEVRAISMLELSALVGLRELARMSRGAVLEIGPYIGGSTIALCRGLADPARPMITVEAGVNRPTHPHLPTSDLVGDLTGNLRRAGCLDRVEIVIGVSHDRLVRDRIAALLGGARIGLLVVDADDMFLNTLAAFSLLLADDACLAIDDYVAPGAPDKERAVRSVIDLLVGDGTLEPFLVAGGTWFGQIRAGRADAVRRLSTTPRFRHEGGHCWQATLPIDAPADTEIAQDARLLLKEDGALLPFAHSDHESIRTIGLGRYSYWQNAPATGDRARRILYLSTSDNTDPNHNRRRYSVEIDGQDHEVFGY